MSFTQSGYFVGCRLDHWKRRSFFVVDTLFIGRVLCRWRQTNYNFIKCDYVYKNITGNNPRAQLAVQTVEARWMRRWSQKDTNPKAEEASWNAQNSNGKQGTKYMTRALVWSSHISVCHYYYSFLGRSEAFLTWYGPTFQSLNSFCFFSHNLASFTVKFPFSAPIYFRPLRGSTPKPRYFSETTTSSPNGWSTRRLKQNAFTYGTFCTHIS